MRVAVLTLTRDRLAYTQHCFQRLQQLAGCGYDHYVLDQGSQDGTVDWLKGRVRWVVACRENIGISRGLNLLLGGQMDGGPLPERYDVIVKIDNDCELQQPDTLKIVCELALAGGALLSPRVEGLMYPPKPKEFTEINGWQIGLLKQIGGIFAACPASFYQSFRYDERNPLWGMDDAQLCHEFPGPTGYVMDLSVNHFETTAGQHKRYPSYFHRRVSEGGPS